MSSTLAEGSVDSAAAANSSDPRANDRNNLLLLTRLVIRGLLEHCMQSKNRWISAQQPHLINLFVMLEKVLRHGFKSNRTLITLRTPEQELWNMIEKLGKMESDANETVVCVQQLPNVHSAMCRVRAWLRLALMQKKLADYFQRLVESKHLVFEYYDDFALLRHETTAVVISGSLIGLNVIDCNLYLKEEDLGHQPLSVDLGWYIKIPTVPLAAINGEFSGSDLYAEETAKEMKNILDQKNYLEEINKQLSANVINLEKRLAVMEGISRFRGSINSVGSISEEKGLECDVPSEVDVLPSLTKFDELHTAMESMEKSIHEKQDKIVDLHQQIDDVKKINLDLYQKLRLSDERQKQKDKSIKQMEKQNEKDKTQLQGKITTLETKLVESTESIKKLTTANDNLRFELKKKTEFCAEIQTDLADSRNSNKMLEESKSLEKLTREELQTKVKALKNTQQEYSDLKLRCQNLERTVKEYETTLEEMGVHLSQSKLKVEDLREGFLPLAEAQWENDKEILSCKLCERKFSVAIRKHHCRNCGRIYCDKCSENTMPLPSSAKPVRVCDSCYPMLLQRFSAKPETS